MRMACGLRMVLSCSREAKSTLPETERNKSVRHQSRKQKIELVRAVEASRWSNGGIDRRCAVCESFDGRQLCVELLCQWTHCMEGCRRYAAWRVGRKGRISFLLLDALRKNLAEGDICTLIHSKATFIDAATHTQSECLRQHSDFVIFRRYRGCRLRSCQTRSGIAGIQFHLCL